MLRLSTAVARHRRRSTVIELVRTRGRSQKSSIARFQYSVLTNGFRVNNVPERRLHHYCCRSPFFTFLLLRNWHTIYYVIFKRYSYAPVTLKVSANVGEAVDGVHTPSKMFQHLVMLDFETVRRGRTRTIAVDRRRRRATDVDGRNARINTCVKPGPHKQQCRSNVLLCRSSIRHCSIWQCCFDIVAGVNRALRPQCEHYFRRLCRFFVL